MDTFRLEPRVAVIGVGGAGCNVISKVFDSVPEADSIAINCDKEAMHSTKADLKLYICRSVTNGQGARGDVDIGRQCAKAHIDDIEKAIAGHDIAFIVAGMGGGTGTGAAPVIAECAQRMGVMTFVIAVDPFSFESGRTSIARDGLVRLKQVCPNMVVVENDRILESMPEATMSTALDAVNRSIAAFIGRKIGLVGHCLTSEFESGSGEYLEKRFEESTSIVSEHIGNRPKTAKE